MPHTIAVPVFPGLSAFEFATAREILGRDRSDSIPEWYRFVTCRVEPGPVVTSHGTVLEPDGSWEDLESAETILIAGWNDLARVPPPALLDTLRSAHEQGRRLVSICTGAFVLAYAGLLDGKTATTHWLHASRFSTLFPAVNLKDRAIYCVDKSGRGPVLTSAGSAAGLDLCLALIRSDFGVAAANSVARRMVAPVHRPGGQAQFIEPQEVGSDDVFSPVLQHIESRIEQSIDLAQVAAEYGYSVRTFQRRFKRFTSMSPHRWLTQRRLMRARELLEQTDLSVERVATECGLGSAANLRKQLRQNLNTTPRAYRSAFQSETAGLE